MNEWPEDSQLMRLIAQKQPQALEQLYDRYERPMYSFAYRIVKDSMMAEEVVQELFLRIWNHAERYEDSQGKLSTWMFAIARNIAIDTLRRKQTRTAGQLAEPDKLLQVADRGRGTEEEVELRFMGEELALAMEDLNEDQKKVIDLIYFKGYTHQEVSRKQEIPLGTVKSRVRLAMKQLKEKLAGRGKEGAPI
ncbi:RNA polymerase sigma factor [Paenibacillus sp. UNC499MF]|uniref:RNA polymerase sigma factor n=1 Tax=Paenibacillus sp. UNC499MF TaxID=1502751 RepID=UPI00089FE1DD|nr:sigma-70 family RNA polymerase sigma factor [Paenibacillus sp. UNC499MF]SEF61280.1 RNA polymerase sigma-70 factor, ECF subfamily [Paenibacillus sp. UNC499MF]